MKISLQKWHNLVLDSVVLYKCFVYYSEKLFLPYPEICTWHFSHVAFVVINKNYIKWKGPLKKKSIVIVSDLLAQNMHTQLNFIRI